jgi:hypothetical protein
MRNCLLVQACPCEPSLGRAVRPFKVLRFVAHAHGLGILVPARSGTNAESRDYSAPSWLRLRIECLAQRVMSLVSPAGWRM